MNSYRAIGIRAAVSLALLIGWCLNLSAQDHTVQPKKMQCSSELLLLEKMKDPEWRKQYDEHNTAIAEQIKQHKTSRASWPAVTIPVVFVVLHDGSGAVGGIDEEVVTKQLDLLNQQFAMNPPVPVEMTFCLANLVGGTPMNKGNSIVPDNTTLTNGTHSITVGSIWQGKVPGIPHPGIFFMDVSLGSGTAIHPPCFPEYQVMSQICLLSEQEYIIIYVANDPGGSSAFLPGYSSGCKPGIVMNPGMFGAPPCAHCSVGSALGKTLAHEVGHYLGLYHTFHGGGCNSGGPPGDPVNGCDLFGDKICDTDPRNSWPAPPNCGATSCGNVIGFENHMDYSDEGCRVEFTPDQKDRMYTTLNAYYPSITSLSNLMQTGCGTPKSEEEEALAIWDAGDRDGIRVFPSPVKGTLHINQASNKWIRIFDLQGREMIQKQSIDSDQWTFNVDFLQHGVYLIQIEDGSGKAEYRDRLLVE